MSRFVGFFVGSRDGVTVEDLVEVARLVRPFLPELVGARAADLDARIGAALDGPPRERVPRLRAVLASDDAVVAWVERALADPAGAVRGFEPLPGQGEPVPADRFVCPVNRDVVWYRPKVGVPVPTCGTHSVVLVRG
jgi:hypothetical protein